PHVGVDGQLPRAVPGEPAHPAARGVRRPARPQDPEVAGECSNECGGAACGPSRFYFEAGAAVTTRGFLFRVPRLVLEAVRSGTLARKREPGTTRRMLGEGVYTPAHESIHGSVGVPCAAPCARRARPGAGRRPPPSRSFRLPGRTTRTSPSRAPRALPTGRSSSPPWPEGAPSSKAS